MKRPTSGGNLVDLERLTQQQAAFLCGVTARAFRDWNAPRNPDGSYSGQTVVKFVLSRQGRADRDLDLNAERARLAKWQADKTEQDVELRSGRMLDADDVQQWVAAMVATARQRLVQIPDTVRQVIHPDHAERVASEVRRLIYEAMAELSARRGDMPRADLAALGAAAESDSQPVGRPVPKAVKRKQRRARTVAN